VSRPVADRPEYGWLREFKKAHGRELLHRYGAHAVGIGRKRTGGEMTDDLALVFYVEHKRPEDELETEPIPPSIPFTPSGMDEPVLLATDVVEAPPAEFEPEGLG
jgi:hypothetical protein